MQFPFIIDAISEKEAKEFIQYFVDDYSDCSYSFEGIWFRTQDERNKNVSSWHSNNDRRKRIVAFKDKYNVIYINDIPHLAISSSIMYLNISLPASEMRDYLNKIIVEIKKYNDLIEWKDENTLIAKIGDIYFEFLFEDYYKLDNMDSNVYTDVQIMTYANAQRDEVLHYRKRILELFKRGIREKEYPKHKEYVESLEEIVQYLPAQIELGCGISIASNIPPLYFLHEVYKVQNHNTSMFYFSEADELLYDVITNREETYKKFSKMVLSCVKAKPNKAHEVLAKLYKNNIFVGEVINNNFDKICSRMGLIEKSIRIFNADGFYPKIEFSPEAKSLICIGTHADRRRVQEQAREKGLKVIYIDPEGFFNDNVFTSYPLESVHADDLVLRMTALDALSKLDEVISKKEFSNVLV